MTCQVKRPEEELYNALAWDTTRPCYVSNGSASAPTFKENKGKGKGVMWAETAT